MDLTNVDLSDTGTINNFIGTAGDWAATLGIILLSVLLFAVIAYFFWRELQFKIPVSLHRVVGDKQIIESKDKARINKRKGEIILKKTKVVQSIPDTKFLVKTLKGWKLYGRWDGHKIIQWQKLSYNSPLTFEPDTYDVYNQMAYRIKNAAARHLDQSFFEKFGSQIMLMTTVLVIAVVLIVLFDKVGEIGPALRDGLNSWAQAAESVNIQRVN